MAWYDALSDGVLQYRDNAQDRSDASDGGCETTDDGVTTYAAVLMPENNSGAFGTTFVTFDQHNATLRVQIEAVGLTPGQAHPQHIHGFLDGHRSSTPTVVYDTDRDGFVETPEGELAIGPILLDLRSDPSNNPPSPEGSYTNYPVADQYGRIHYDETFYFDNQTPDDDLSFQQLQLAVAGRTVELHGQEIPSGEGSGTDFEVNGGGGYVPILPVAGGILKEVDSDVAASLFVAEAWLLS